MLNIDEELQRLARGVRQRILIASIEFLIGIVTIGWLMMDNINKFSTLGVAIIITYTFLWLFILVISMSRAFWIVKGFLHARTILNNLKEKYNG